MKQFMWKIHRHHHLYNDYNSEDDNDHDECSYKYPQQKLQYSSE